MEQRDILVTGPIGPETGGIAQYIEGQTTRLKDRPETAVRTFDTAPFTNSSVNKFESAPPEDSGPLWFVVLFFKTVVDMLRFPFRSQPDIVHVHTSQDFAFLRSTYYVLFSRYVWRRPVVLHIHGSSFEEFVTADSLLLVTLQSVVFDASDAVIVLSEYWKNALSLRVPEEKLHVLPNAVDSNQYDPQFEVETPEVVFVSNHKERKGVVEFTQAVSELCQHRNGSVEVTIAGSGPQSAHAKQVAAKYSNVEYVGYVSESEKQSLLNRASVYVLPSYAEGLPLGLLEGMAGGNAVVSTAVGSIPEAIDENNGILVEPRNTDALASALESLVSSPDVVEDMSRNNRELVESEYDWQAITKDLVTLYEEVA